MSLETRSDRTGALNGKRDDARRQASVTSEYSQLPSAFRPPTVTCWIHWLTLCPLGYGPARLPIARLPSSWRSSMKIRLSKVFSPSFSQKQSMASCNCVSPSGAFSWNGRISRSSRPTATGSPHRCSVAWQASTSWSASSTVSGTAPLASRRSRASISARFVRSIFWSCGKACAVSCAVPASPSRYSASPRSARRDPA